MLGQLVWECLVESWWIQLCWVIIIDGMRSSGCPSPCTDTSHNAVLLSHILDILSLCVERHTYHIRNYVIDKNVLGRVLVLLTSSHTHLALGRSLGDTYMGCCLQNPSFHLFYPISLPLSLSLSLSLSFPLPPSLSLSLSLSHTQLQ